MREPRYTAVEQRERMAEFEHWVERARAQWKKGTAVVLMGFRDYLELSGVPFYQKQRRDRLKGRRGQSPRSRPS